MDPEIPEDENLHVSSPQDFAAELDDDQVPDNSAGSSKATGER